MILSIILESDFSFLARRSTITCCDFGLCGREQHVTIRGWAGWRLSFIKVGKDLFELIKGDFPILLNIMLPYDLLQLNVIDLETTLPRECFS